ncbi:hypothetical protein [Sphingomonas sp.]|uniref:hypothetical protein n=1 Tax=Sphingomonas sp. TaxID=28214 RepID=UPI002E302431|nr:hypothetical protein [Sphingomonas sp.]HEX4695718.1 hypothetical protein [Sphingomonas sp.]
MLNEESQSAGNDAWMPTGIASAPSHSSVQSTESLEAPRWTIRGTNVGLEELLILGAAFILFVLGVFVSQAGKDPDRYPTLMSACVLDSKDPKICAVAINDVHEHMHTFLHYNILEALAEGLKALSVAITVTVGVASILDARNRKKLNAALAGKAQQIAINVFDGLFSNNHSPDLLEKLKRDILYKPIIRESLTMVYVLRTYTGKRRLSGQKFTAVKATVSSTFRNIATTAGSVAHLPLELSLPNPLLNELKKLTTLDRVVIKRQNQKDQMYTAPELVAKNLQLQAALKDDKALEGAVSFGELLLQPNEQGGFEIEYTMMKEAEDSELLRSFHTTQSLDLTVIDNTDRDLVVRAKAVHAGSLNPMPSAQFYSHWELREIVLPQQGVLIWWKERLPSAAKAERKTVPQTPDAGVN